MASRVYTREREQSPIKAFRVVSTFETPQETILSVLLNISSYADWYDHFKIAETILNDQAAVTYYMEMSMPFPFDNRDAVYRLFLVQRPLNTFDHLKKYIASVK